MIRMLNCFTCNARIPASWESGTLCLLIESEEGLILVDTGPGIQDYHQRPGILRLFQVLTKVPLDPNQAAVRQIDSLGYKPRDVRHIVLTHMHFDHCGGLADFPNATVHVHRDEYESFNGRRSQWTDFAYVRHHIAHNPKLNLYLAEGESWFGFDAIPLPLEPEMFLIPLFGHSRGHCGVAVRQGDGWLFHVADAAPIAFDESLPQPVVGFVLGPHTPRLREFREMHPEISMTTGHLWLDFFEESPKSSPQQGFNQKSE